MAIETRSRTGRTKTWPITDTTTKTQGKVTMKKTSWENRRKDKNNKLMETHTDARARPTILS